MIARSRPRVIISAVSGEVTIRNVPERSRYELERDGEPVGLLAYYLSDGEISLVHAEVDPAHGHQGFASELTRTALADARARGLHVRPLCPFVVDYIARHPGVYDDLV